MAAVTAILANANVPEVVAPETEPQSSVQSGQEQAQQVTAPFDSMVQEGGNAKVRFRMQPLPSKVIAFTFLLSRLRSALGQDCWQATGCQTRQLQ
jgi:hypothetical protein